MMIDEVITTHRIKLSFCYKHRRNFVTSDAGKSDTCLMQKQKSYLALIFRQLLLLKCVSTLDHPLTNFSLMVFILRAAHASCGLSMNLLLMEFGSIGKISFVN